MKKVIGISAVVLSIAILIAVLFTNMMKNRLKHCSLMLRLLKKQKMKRILLWN